MWKAIIFTQYFSFKSNLYTFFGFILQVNMYVWVLIVKTHKDIPFLCKWKGGWGFNLKRADLGNGDLLGCAILLMENFQVWGNLAVGGRQSFMLMIKHGKGSDACKFQSHYLFLKNDDLFWQCVAKYMPPKLGAWALEQWIRDGGLRNGKI